jgi:hypothetical protein
LTLARYACARALLVGLLLAGGVVLADPEPPVISESQIKAAFVYNFTKFVEWPADSFPTARDPIVIGVLGEGALTIELQTIVADRRVNGRTIVVTNVQTVEQVNAAQVLFVSAAEDARFAELHAAVRNSPVLTVGESPAFSAAGGAISFVQQGSKLRFEINMASAERSGLKISGQLQALAVAVKRAE